MQEKNNIVKEVENVVVESSAWEQISAFLNFKLHTFTNVKGVEVGVLSVKYVLLVIAIFTFVTFAFSWIKKRLTRDMPKDDKSKFGTVFSFVKWFVYSILLLGTMNAVGVDLTAVLTASAALLIGVGLALQTLFQDIISGVFILIDQSVHVGDIVEIEGKVGRIEEIKLRTTRAVTIDDKVLVIPNHLYLTKSLYNWTQNGTSTRESVDVGVAYGSDVQLVKSLLIKAVKSSDLVLNKPEPKVVFMDFGDSSLNFKVVFTIEDSFNAREPKSEVRFAIYKLFNENKISIPFPQRDVHVIQK